MGSSMASGTKRTLLIAVALVIITGFGWLVVDRIRNRGAAGGGPVDRVAPVAVADVEHGPIELRRTFSGTLEARARFDVSPKVGGRIVQLNVDIGDPVTRGQVIAELDDDEFVQAVALADAELAVARANHAEAESQFEVAQRELERMQTLRERGVSSESQLDTVLANHRTAEASVKVAQAQVSRAAAALETARIRLGYTKVAAAWVEGDDSRRVAERYVDPGDTITANTPIVSIVETSPLVGVIYVTENDYGRILPGQAALLTTDAFPGQTFDAAVIRIAPVFRASSRQARVELEVGNDDLRLKPGMFIRATIVLDHADDAVIVPESAITRRDGVEGVFHVSDDGASVSWTPVAIGIRQGQRVQVIDTELTGRVVTLGQQLIDDGSAITIPDGDAAPSPTSGTEAP
jgi:RND family efflux transporter MFP subunit